MGAHDNDHLYGFQKAGCEIRHVPQTKSGDISSSNQSHLDLAIEEFAVRHVLFFPASYVRL